MESSLVDEMLERNKYEHLWSPRTQVSADCNLAIGILLRTIDRTSSFLRLSDGKSLPY
jgi:hypothetical protein